jgi:hypothetical protein
VFPHNVHVFDLFDAILLVNMLPAFWSPDVPTDAQHVDIPRPQGDKAWTTQGHLAPQSIDERPQFIQAGFAQENPQTRNLKVTFR